MLSERVTVAGDENANQISGNFLIDAARTEAALEKLTELARQTEVVIPGDKTQQEILADPALKSIYMRSMTMLEWARQSDYFNTIKNKLQHNEFVTAAEYYYFAMTTDNVNTLDVSKLKQMWSEHDKLPFGENCDVLIAFREWQDADHETKSGKNSLLRNACRNRGKIRLAGRKQFLNLHGANFAASDLTSTPLDAADLGSALFARATLYDASITLSCLDRANLSEATCKVGVLEDAKGIEIMLTSARNANFDSFHAANTSFMGSDLTHSTFRLASINGDFNHAILDEVNFSGTKLGFSWPQINTVGCSLVNAVLQDTILININFDQFDFSHAQFFHQDILTSINLLEKAFDDLTLNIINYFRQLNMAAADINHYLNQLHTIIMKNVITAINQMGNDILQVSEKLDLLEALLRLPVLGINHDLDEAVNIVTKCCTTLFSRANAAAQAITPVVQLLQTTIDEINKVNHRM